jgi:hypothetical protein
MSDELEDSFEAVEEEQPTEQPEEIAEGVVEAGAEAEAEAPPEESPKAETIPLATFLDMRDENKTLKRQIAEASRPQQAEAPSVPDVLEDPEGFGRSIQGQISSATLNAQLNVSETMARESHGDGVVDEAFQAAIDAGVAGSFRNHRHPYGEIVKWHKQQKAVAEIGDPDVWRAKERETIRAEELAKIQAAQVATQVTAPTLADATSIGGRQAPAPTLTSLDDIL